MTPGRERLLLLIPTSSYRTEAYVQAAHQLGVSLTVASEHDSVFSHPDRPDILTLDFSNPRAAAGAIAEFADDHPISAVVGVDDSTVVVAATIATELGLRHNPIQAARAAGDKYRQRQVLQDAGVAVPAFRLMDATTPPAVASRAVTFPAVLKPVSLSASRGVMRVDSPAEFAEAHGRLVAILSEEDVPPDTRDVYIVEDYVEGPEYALEGLLVEGQLRTLALFDKPDPLDGPFFEETIYVTPSRAPDDVQASLVACAEEAVRALGLLWGPVHVELRHNRDGSWLIELAARSIGGRCAQALHFGPEGEQSLEEVLLAAALGRIDEPPPLKPRSTGVMMIPIPRTGWLSRVEGVEDALSVRWIRSVQITAHRGQRLRTLPEASRYLGFVFAEGPGPATVERALREAHAKIGVVMGED